MHAGTDNWRGRHPRHRVLTLCVRRGRNGFDGIESRWEGVPGSELP